MPQNVMNGNPPSQSAEQAGQNGGLQIPDAGNLGRNVLSQMLAQIGTPVHSETEVPLQAEPEATAEEQPAHEESPAEAAGAADENQPDRQDDGNVLSQPETQEDEIADPDVQKHVAELAKLLKGGGITIGEVKRIEKLLKGKGELEGRLEQLQTQLEELKNGNAVERVPTESSENPFSATVKDGNGVRQMQRQMHDIREWCEDNEGGGSFRGRDYSAEQVKELKREAGRALSIWLPERAEQIVQQSQTQATQAQVLSQVKAKRPDLFNIENPLAQRRQFFAQHPRIVNDPNREYIAACLALGEQVFNAKPAAAKALPKPNAAKPSSVMSGGTAATKVNPNKIAEAKARVETERSRGSLANFIRATNGA